jgi:hypothetical protein
MVGRQLQAARQTELPTRFLVLHFRLNSEIESGKPVRNSADYQHWSEQAHKTHILPYGSDWTYNRNLLAVLYPLSATKVMDEDEAEEAKGPPKQRC